MRTEQEEKLIARQRALEDIHTAYSRDLRDIERDLRDARESHDVLLIVKLEARRAELKSEFSRNLKTFEENTK